MINLKIQKENLMLFGASFVIAIFLSLQVHTQIDPISKEGFALMLNIKNFPEGMVITKKNERIGVIIEGPISILKTFTLDSVEAYIDLSHARVGTNQYPVKLNIKDLHGLSIHLKHPTEKLVIEKLIARSIPITIKEKGFPPKEILYGGAYSKPNIINVIGPASSIKKIYKAYATLDLSALSLNSTYLSNIQLSDVHNEIIREIEPDPTTVSLIASTALAPTQKRVPINVAWKGTMPFGHYLKSFSLKPNQVVITGNNLEVMQVTSVETLPVDLSNITQSQVIITELKPIPSIQIKDGNTIEINIELFTH